MNQIAVTQKCVVAGGDTLEQVLAYECEAYDIISITLTAGQSDIEVDLQPLGGTVTLLMITTPNNVYGTDELSYKIHAIGSAANYLNNAHLYAGAGAIGALQLDCDKLFLANGAAVSRTFKILVGRDATP